MLVDDNPANLKILYETLDGRGYRLLVADNGDQALRIAAKEKPDLILLDIMMPGMDGFEVCRRLKADPETRQASVIFLSALDDTDSKVKGFDLGGVDYIAKPFQIREVLSRVETHLKIHRLERQLEAQNRQLTIDKSRILASMNEGIYGLNSRGEILFANTAACRMNRCEESRLLGQHFISLHFQQADIPAGGNNYDLDRITERLTRALAHKEPFKVSEAIFVRPEGSVFPVSFSVAPVDSDASETWAVVVFHDISDELARREELREARESLESQREQLATISRLSTMGEMAAGIAHEVNQPLTAVSNYVRVARRLLDSEPPKPGKLREALEKIEQQCLRASEVIQHIRHFVKRPLNEYSVVAPADLVEELRALAEIDVRHHSMTLEIKVEAGLPRIRGDVIQIQQVILNLIRNAVEASVEAGVHAGVTLHVFHRDDQVYFEVCDRGPGLTEAQAAKLFTPFFTTKAQGMGIGLTLCQSIIHSHGGKIGYCPNPEGGAIFHFSLPVYSG